MLLKKIIAGCFLISVILCGSCFEDKSTPTTPSSDPRDTVLPTDNLTTETANGSFRITIEGQKGTASFLGRVNDGTTPPTEVYTVIKTDGPCKLLKRASPNCSPECGGSAACIAENTCQPYPHSIKIDTVAVTGLQLGNGKTSFKMAPIGYNYMPKAEDSLTFPPCGERDLIKLSGAGGGTVPAFAVTLKGVTPLKILPNDTAMIPCDNGQDVKLQWTPPSKLDGSSRIFISIDISYHGGTKAKIECDCDDDGEQVIPGKMLDSLKSFGISGFPRIEMYRRSSASDPTSKIRFVMESYVALYLKIPGVVSCGGGMPPCETGYECGSDQRCRPIGSSN